MINFISEHKWIISLFLVFVIAPIFIGLASIKNLPVGFQIYFVFIGVCASLGGIVSFIVFLIYNSLWE